MTKKRSAAKCTPLAAHEQARRELRAFWERQPAARAHLRETMRRTDVQPLPMPVPPGRRRQVTPRPHQRKSSRAVRDLIQKSVDIKSAECRRT